MLARIRLETILSRTETLPASMLATGIKACRPSPGAATLILSRALHLGTVCTRPAPKSLAAVCQGGIIRRGLARQWWAVEKGLGIEWDAPWTGNWFAAYCLPGIPSQSPSVCACVGVRDSAGIWIESCCAYKLGTLPWVKPWVQHWVVADETQEHDIILPSFPWRLWRLGR